VTGAFAGPLDFFFGAWLAIASLGLLFTQRRRQEAPAESAS
jgi:hypothetical protein